MINISEVTKCCGCKSCEEICPQNAIIMTPDKETFLYPLIDNQKCINCGLCERVCPENFKSFTPYSEVIPYVGINKDIDTVINSSSGGAFFAICQIFISSGYSIFGVKYEDDLKVVHDVADTLNDCYAFQKSKYVLSDTNGCFNKISVAIKNGKKVLFSGTSCQCAALQMYMKVKRIPLDNLFIVNILCHGCPSQELFDKYIDDNKIDKYTFRYKENVEEDSIDSRRSFITYNDGSNSIGTTDNDAFLRAYYKRLFYRPSCYQCKFAKMDRCSDITIGDAWGLEQFVTEQNNGKGVSLLLFNTDKGKGIIEKIRNLMSIYSIDKTIAFNSQSIFSKPTASHPNRSLFFSLLEKSDFNKAVMSATKPTIMGVFNNFRKNGINRTIRKIIKRIKK